MQPLQLLLCDSEFLRLLMGRQLWSGMGQYLIHVLQAGSAACSTAAQCKAIGRRIAPRVGQRHPVGGAHRHDTTKVVGSAQPFQVGATSEVWQLLSCGQGHVVCRIHHACAALVVGGASQQLDQCVGFQMSTGLQQDDPFIFVVVSQWLGQGFARAHPLHVTSQLLRCKGCGRIGMNDDTPRGKPALTQLVHGVGQSALIAPLAEQVNDGWSHFA